MPLKISRLQRQERTVKAYLPRTSSTSLLIRGLSLGVSGAWGFPFCKDNYYLEGVKPLPVSPKNGQNYAFLGQYP